MSKEHEHKKITGVDASTLQGDEKVHVERVVGDVKMGPTMDASTGSAHTGPGVLEQSPGTAEKPKHPNGSNGGGLGPGVLERKPSDV